MPQSIDNQNIMLKNLFENGFQNGSRFLNSSETIFYTSFKELHKFQISLKNRNLRQTGYAHW
jgi:hypothetical protein